MDFYAQMKELGTPVLECVQRPGEIIYVPHGWSVAATAARAALLTAWHRFHIVLNLEPSIAITHNYVSESNLHSVMRFLTHSPEHVSGVSEKDKALLGPRLRQALQTQVSSRQQAGSVAHWCGAEARCVRAPFGGGGPPRCAQPVGSHQARPFLLVAGINARKARLMARVR